jgi:sec-independent protein translocase protein TatB
MIDFGLTKLMLIGAVALVVIGPEKLPRVARMAGTLFGRVQRYMNDVKAEVSREMELDELRKMQDEFKQAASDVSQSVSKTFNETKSEFDGVLSDIKGENSIGGAIGSDRTPDAEGIARKARNFRRKKLARGAVPSWYKQQTGQKTRVVSAAARVAKYRPASLGSKHTFFQ